MLYLLVISYDIACQYCKNFEKRFSEDFPESEHLDLDDTEIRWVIPKNHLPVHGPNHSRYSLNFVDKVGRTYGEGIKSSWGSLNPISMLTREMALATRHEVINDHIGSWNWTKTIEFGSHLKKGLRKAAGMAQKQRTLFQEFSDTFPSGVVKEWERLVSAWNADPSAVDDPYEEPQANVHGERLRKELAIEDSTTSTIPHLADMSQSIFLQLGLEIEDQQRTLKSSTGNKELSGGDVKVDVIERRNVLRRRIQHWVEAQNVYMPSLTQLRIRTLTVIHSLDELDHGEVAPRATKNSTPYPEDTVLWLPSALPSSLRVGDLTTQLLGMELRLRLAQAEDSLTDIRRLRRIMKGISEFKCLNISGTGNKANTKARTLYTSFERKQKQSADRYRAAYRSLTSIDPTGEWRSQFRQLLDSDLTGPGRGVQEDVRGEGYREISWIWRTGSSTTSDSDSSAEYNKSMRAEWAQTRARAERWQEEVELLQEEMRRVIHFLQWRSRWWCERKALRADIISSDLADGIGVYALRQSTMCRELAKRFAHSWLPLLRSLNNGIPAWASDYVLPMAEPKPKNVSEGVGRELAEAGAAVLGGEVEAGVRV
ncbi:hypothetical protein TRAPUB_13392 [Trametes pubescens]|uniref:Uncharacterized protein n=1 Tax=Trametes pubescens TaxID=154538 RepID=A0A1M2VR86_TRAPU|nr:hypothetical protein TRAPUB_13392 [Trametes pubescens]